ncbi:MAG: hypothetical protein HUK22_06900, partial [Thermoguttaceae bacterium]|nr:hypothetical protein [Thermoguttaceae bacterium]
MDEPRCKYATPTEKPWNSSGCACKIIECRSPAHIADYKAHCDGKWTARLDAATVYTLAPKDGGGW